MLTMTSKGIAIGSSALALLCMIGCGGSPQRDGGRPEETAGRVDPPSLRPEGSLDIPSSDPIDPPVGVQDSTRLRLESMIVDTAVFPLAPYSSVQVVMLDRGWERMDGVRPMPYLNSYGAKGFIDSTGRPIHKHFRSVVLNQHQRKELEHLLRATPPLEDSNMGMECDCLPVYRDAILFKNARGKPVAWISICFFHEEVRFMPEAPLLRGFEFYRGGELRTFFEALGADLRQEPPI
jgi:hypothetical protein